MTDGERDVWWRIWAAIDDGDEPTQSIPADLAEVNRRLADVIERIRPQLEPSDLECLSGVSHVLAAIGLALTGEHVNGRDTYLSATFQPRSMRRVRHHDRNRRLGAASERRAELRAQLRQGKRLKAHEADVVAAKEFDANRTDLKGWEARHEKLFTALGGRPASKGRSSDKK